ncbi:ABC transporter permease [Actinocatenispora comari]|jgi:osmoprotectant transport system permease protein|uniref:Permease n=1 Tax=Actinocatenispora comari TaxID=2807577 RepID=A0A8J4AFW3_9ACTN|nr:ABC transporter permease [Actinocatenispora comari]GIL28442.1 permease [Actinocatenispora comari]
MTLAPDARTGPGELAPDAAVKPKPRRKWYLVGTPALIVVALLLDWLYVRASHPDANARTTLQFSYLGTKLLEHLKLTVVAGVFVLLIAIPLGVLLSRRGARFAMPIVLALANIGQGAPAIGIIVLLAVLWQTGFTVAVVALVIYAVLPSLRNTMVGLQQIDPALKEAGRGIGMSSAAVLFKVELPLAVPVILAGIRTTLVLLIGVAALSSLIGAGGLGEMISTGVQLQRYNVLVTGSVLVACLALFVDWLASLAERYLRPRGI